ncbi:urea ABC transporter substrate-binding protein, partial [Mesorhizobium sp. M7A.T.Ca.TU.009.01.3.2]
MRGNFSTITKMFSAGVVAAGLLTSAPVKAADDTIKVGILHSLSGTMA